MLCLEDCLDFCDLNASEVEVIARHEHVPMIVAAELGINLLKTNEGIRCIETYFLETAESARKHGCLEDAGRYMAVYQQFHLNHPT